MKILKFLSKFSYKLKYLYEISSREETNNVKKITFKIIFKIKNLSSPKFLNEGEISEI